MTDTSPALTPIGKLYGTKEIAELFSVTPETVRNWILSNKLKASQTPGNQYRVARADLLAFATQHYGVDSL